MSRHSNVLWACGIARANQPPQWQPITLGDQLNAGAYGGTATIHRVTTTGMVHLVAKLFNDAALPYKRTTDAHEKLAFIARCSGPLRQGHATAHSRVAGRPHVAWPTALLYVQQAATPDNLAGFLMPVFAGTFPLQQFYTPRHRKQHFPNASVDAMMATAASLAGMVDDLHGGAGDSGMVIGDLTPRNVLIDGRYQLRLIDADSFQYTTRAGVHGTNESTPGFRSPAIARASKAGTSLPRFTRADDTYALAILIFHLLVDGAHPWRAGSRFEINGVAPEEEDNLLARRFPYAAPDQMHPPRIRLQTYQRLPHEVRFAFERTFLNEQPLPAAEWIRLLGRARSQMSQYGRPRPATRVTLLNQPKEIPHAE